jgi:hypothetical protein
VREQFISINAGQNTSARIDKFTTMALAYRKSNVRTEDKIPSTGESAKHH